MRTFISLVIISSILVAVPIAAQTYSNCNPLTSGKLQKVTDWHYSGILILLQAAVHQILRWAHQSISTLLLELPTLLLLKAILLMILMEPPLRSPIPETRRN